MFQKTKTPSLSNLLTIESLNSDIIHQLIERATEYSAQGPSPKHNVLSNKIIANLFFEPSTRTQYAFEIAARALHATSITPNIPNLSTLKGESLLDTIHNFEAMGTSLFIIRHGINHTPEFIASELLTEAKVLNAGDGTHQHPSQCLIDLMTINQHFPDFTSLSVAILGDTFRSRVANSVTLGLQKMGTTDIRMITPPLLIPENQEQDNNYLSSSIEEGLADADVIICLRVQKERMGPTANLDPAFYFKQYALTAERLKLAKPHAIVMHPGPINRGFEIESAVADGEQSAILQQAKNSVPMRMALLEALLS